MHNYYFFDLVTLSQLGTTQLSWHCGQPNTATFDRNVRCFSAYLFDVFLLFSVSVNNCYVVRSTSICIEVNHVTFRLCVWPDVD